jgi:hypothetical protein
MPRSTQSAVSDGTLVTLILTIKYIDKADVTVLVNNIPLVVDVDYEWATATSITFMAPVPAGDVVLLVRRTELDNVLNIFADGASFNNKTMDENFEQLLFVGQEAQENTSLTDVFNDLDMHGKTLFNLADAVGPTNPVTLAQLNAYAADSAGTLRSDMANTADPLKGAGLMPTAARVVATVAALRNLPDSGSTTAFVLGHTLFGLGGGVYSQVSSDLISADNNGSVIVATSGMRWKLVGEELNPLQFGARGDKVTDDTVAIQACYNAVKNGGTMRILTAPGDAYIISYQGVGGYVLDFSRPVHIRADGLFSSLQPAAGTTVGTVLLRPNPALPYQGMKWDGLSLGDPYTGLRQGLNGIFIDTGVAGSNLPAANFNALNIGVGSETGARGIVHVNNPGNNVNGGMYATTFTNCPMLKGGIDLQSSGDSNVIRTCVISGPGCGVSASLIVGASLLVIAENNITSLGGSIRISAGSRYKILRNNCEQIAATAGVQYMFDIDGAAGTMSLGEIRGNHLGAFTGTGILANIRLGNNIGAQVGGNTLLPASAGGIGVLVTASNNSVCIEPNVYGSDITRANRVVDQGVGTSGVRKTPVLAAGWVNFGAGFDDAHYYKDTSGTVHLGGTIKSGTTTPGTGMFQLPDGFRPAALRIFGISQSAGAGSIFGACSVNSGGVVSIQTGANNQFSLDGVSFQTLDSADAISNL